MRGNGNFVETIIKEADDLVKKQVPENSQQKRIVRVMQGICDTREVNIKEIISGSRRRFASDARRIIACRLVKDHGLPCQRLQGILVLLPPLYLR